jgi:hypothetical protein
MRKNPQTDKATRRIKRDAIKAIESRISKLDGRNLGVATRQSMPELPQASSTAIQNDDAQMLFTVGHSRIGGTDVIA